MSEGRPRIIREEVEQAEAVVHLFFPGNGGGDALADILFGDVNPSGKMPFTYPRYTNDLMPYYHKYSEDAANADGNDYTDPFINPQFAFGFGLSYTTFEYSNLRINQTAFTSKETVEVTVTVKNTG